MSKKIDFVTIDQEVHDKIEIPRSAKSFIPDWYKKADSYIGGKMKPTENGLLKDIKLCVPFLDVMTAGYNVELLCDIIVERKGGTTHFHWTETPAPIAMRDRNMAHTMPRPAGHEKQMHAWVLPYGPRTPMGYSCLVTHPFNRFDLPFTTTSGIIDSDNYSMPGEVPFFFKEGFEGILPAGTPVAQIIPFKRDNWKSSKAPLDMSFVRKQIYSVQKTISGGYKKLHWSRKSYE